MYRSSSCYYEKVGSEVKNINDEIDFDLPDGWAFARMNSLVYIQTGASFKKEQATADSTQTRVLRGGNILQGEYKFFDNDIFIDSQLVSDSILLLKNDLITPAVTSIENIGKLALIEQDYNKVTAGGFVFIIRPCFNLDVFARYMLYALQSSYFNKQLKSITKKSGQAFYNLGKERLIQLIVPIPPAKEQERIVNEIEKFAPLINEYNLLEQKATRLDTEIYDKLKKSILQYAIQGKLVKQDENDEPASVLLERIRVEKKAQLGKKYIESYIYKGDDNCYYEHIGGKDINITEEIPFEIPDSWRWIRLGDLLEIARGGSPRPIKEYLTTAADGVNWIKIGDTEKGGKYINSTKEKIKPSGVSKSRLVHKGDLLLTNSMSFGRPYILNIDGCIHDGWLVFSDTFHAFNKEFLYYILSSPFAYMQFIEKVSGAVVKNLNSDKVAHSVFPIPPLAEQKRIVDRINEIFARL